MSKRGDVVIELRRPYLALGLSGLFFGLCAAFYFWKASTNDRGLVLNGLVHLGPSGADLFYGTLGALSAAFVALAALALVRYARLEHFRLVLGRRELTMPIVRPLAGVNEVRVEYGALLSVELQPPGRPALLVVHSQGGVHRLQTRLLPPDRPADEVASLIAAKMRAAGPRGPG